MSKKRSSPKASATKSTARFASSPPPVDVPAAAPVTAVVEPAAQAPPEPVQVAAPAIVEASPAAEPAPVPEAASPDPAASADPAPAPEVALPERAGAVPAAAVSPVVLHSLTLTGFAPFQKPTRLSFPTGLGVFVAPNEAGKSAWIAGLRAVLFGMPPFLTDNGKSGRYAEGNLDLTVRDGRRGSLRRDLGTGRLEWLVEGQAEPEWVSEDPLDSTERVGGLLGLSSSSLFDVLAWVRPSAAGTPLELALQALVSGGTPCGQALDDLRRDVGDSTRRGSEYGLPSVDDGGDRPLDELVRRIAERARAVEETGRSLDALEVTALELAEVLADMEALDRRRLDIGEREEAWRRGSAVEDRRRFLWEQSEAMGRALDNARKMEEGARRLRHQVETDPASGLDEKTTEESLEALIRLEWDRARLKTEIRDLDAACESAEQVVAAISVAAASTQARANSEGAVEEAARRAQAEALRAQAREALRRWSLYQDYEKRVAALRQRLKEYDAFAQADPGTLDKLGDMARQRAKLQKQMQDATRELEPVEIRLAFINEEQERNRKSAPDVARLDSEKLPAIDAKIKVFEQREKLQALEHELRQDALHALRQSDVMTTGLAVAGAALGAAATLLLKQPPSSIPLMSVAVGFLASMAGLLFTRMEVSDSADELKSSYEMINEKAEQVDFKLGDLAGAGHADLVALLDRYERYQERSTELDDMQRKLPRPKKLQMMRLARDEAEKALAELDKQVEAFAGKFDDVSLALQSWKHVRRELEYVEAEWSALCQEEWESAPEAVPALVPDEVGGKWRQLARHLEGRGKVGTVAELSERLRAMVEEPVPEEGGRDVSTSSGSGDGPVRPAATRAREAVEDLERRRDEAEQALIARNRQIAALTGQVNALLKAAGGDPSEARTRWRRLQDLRQRRSATEAALTALLESWQAPDADALEQRLNETREELRAVEAEMKSLAARVSGRGEGGEPVLTSDLESLLERERTEATEALQACRERYRKLSSLRAWLEGRELVNLPATERDLRSMRERAEMLAMRVEGLVVAWRELGAAIEAFSVARRPALQEAATRYLQEITGGTDRALAIDGGLHVSLVEGDRVLKGPMSAGLREQCLLALRLAVAEVLGEGARVPLLVDEPLGAFDDTRLEHLRATLRRLAAERQVVVFTHLPQAASWGEPATVGASAASS